MMLNTKAVIEAKFVAQLKLAPEFLIALMGHHTGLAPDVRKMCEFNCALPFRQTAIWCANLGGPGKL